MNVIKSISFFLTAGLFEIAGGYLVWAWLKNGKPFWYGLAGIGLLIRYGFITTLQASNFGRIYATYGGVFIILSLIWVWKVDKIRPDNVDVFGTLICLVGVTVIMLPRK